MLTTKDMPRPTGWLCLAAVTMTTLAMMADVTSAYRSICSKSANKKICYHKLSVRFPMVGRALTDDHYIRFGKNIDKRFLRFGRPDADSSLDDMLRLAIAHAQSEDTPLYIRKRRSTAEAPQEAAQAASADYPEGFNQINKRFLRFRRGDPFLRFGKRATDLADLEEGFLRFGRSLPQPTLLDVLATEGALSRKRRDVSSSSTQNKAEELKRTTRDVEDGGFLRFGRGGDSALDEEVALEGPAAKRGDVANGDREYLRFGRGGAAPFPRWGKRYLRFGRSGSEGFLRFGKRS